MEDQEESKFRRLRTFNVIAGLFLLVQAIAIVFLSNSFKLPINTYYLHFNATTQVLAPVENTIYQLRVGLLVALFLLISTIDHLLVASPFANRWYVKNLKKHVNYARWYDYALSASVIILVIALLSGVYDIAALIPLFCLDATMNLFGLMMELHNQKTEKTNWTAFIFGSFAGVIPWIVIVHTSSGRRKTHQYPPLSITSSRPWRSSSSCSPSTCSCSTRRSEGGRITSTASTCTSSSVSWKRLRWRGRCLQERSDNRALTSTVPLCATAFGRPFAQRASPLFLTQRP